MVSHLLAFSDSLYFLPNCMLTVTYPLLIAHALLSEKFISSPLSKVIGALARLYDLLLKLGMFG